MGKRIDLTGKRFGRWTVVSESDLRDCNGNIMWNCKCDCGREKAVSGNSLRKRLLAVLYINHTNRMDTVDGADNVIALIFWPLLVVARIGIACYRIIKRLLK